MKKIIALLLILAMIFSLAACNSADEEESAIADELVTEDENVKQENNQESADEENKNTQTESEKEQEDTSADEENKNTQTESEKEQEDTSEDEENKNTQTEESEKEQTPPQSDSEKYTVTFDFGFDNKNQTEDTDGKVTELTPERAGYKFEGWYNGADKFDFSTVLSGDIKLVAKWSLETYTITYVGENLPSENPTSYTIDSGEINLTAPEIIFKIFSGWEISNGQKTIISLSIPRGMTGDLTLKPVFNETNFSLGKYECDNNTKNGQEDIVWIKLKEEKGKTLLISKEIIDAKPYDTAGGAVINWSNCFLREWLNGGFYNTVFSAEEKSAIIETTNTTVDKNYTSTSNDLVFILSLQEVQETMVAYAPRYAKVTPYAMANGAIEGLHGGWWWLRNKTSDYGAMLCEDNGIFNHITGYNTKLTTIGVRPCIWVDSAKLK